MTPAQIAILIFFILLGATTQRVTGMGFGLVASPFLVLVLGPVLGVQLTQIMAGSASAIVLFSVWRKSEVKTALILWGFALLGILPGKWLIGHSNPAVLQIITGSLVLISLLTIISSERARIFKGHLGQAGAGFISGFMNVTAGVGGPAIVLYSLSINWKHESFVATTQLYFLLLNMSSLVVVGFPSLPLHVLILAIGTMICGLTIGHFLSRIVPIALARKLVILVALSGSLSTIIKGIWTLH